MSPISKHFVDIFNDFVCITVQIALQIILLGSCWATHLKIDESSFLQNHFRSDRQHVYSEMCKAYFRYLFQNMRAPAMNSRMGGRQLLLAYVDKPDF